MTNFAEQAYVAALHPDEAFDTPKCSRRWPFDGEEMTSRLCHHVAGSAIPFQAEWLRGGFRRGHFNNPTEDQAVMEALSELSLPEVQRMIEYGGVSVREVARFVRRAGPRNWKTVRALNAYTTAGNPPLPEAIAKRLLAGHFSL